ncbi:MAG: hypothetical protein Q8M01_14850 [Rubrivivax sp.]|nr:hypothetical protein [Rubrivivax sp.]
MLTSVFTRRRLAALLAGAAALIASLPSQAVPAWARQTGKACVACHFQHYPALNDFGMDFKASGYVDIKAKPLAGKDLSIADTLYASLFSKIRWQKTNGSDGLNADGEKAKTTHSGELQFPDEFAILLGGRVGQHVGFMLEGQLAGDGAVLAGFKMPMMWPLGESGMKAGVVPFTTDALGASYGFELFNTGAVRNVRISEHRAETSAQQYVFFQGTGPLGGETNPVSGAQSRNTAGAATGFSFVLYNPLFFVVVAPHTPNHLAGAESQLGGLNATYFRAAVTPSFQGWSLGAGVQAWSGNNVRFNDGGAGVFSNDIATVQTKGWAIDAQAQGNVGSMPLGLYLAHARAPGTAAGSATPNLFNANRNARTATTLTAELGVLPQKATVVASFRRADNGANASSKDNALTLGATYQVYQNLQLQLMHSRRSDGSNGVGRYGPNYAAGGTVAGDALTTFMLSVGY